MSMITNVYYAPTLLGALGNTYATGSYVRTLGFAEAGDGGAAMYRVAEATPANESSTTINNISFYCGDGCFYQHGGTVFELISQNGSIYVDQFGVLPDNTDYCINNTLMMNQAIEYVSSHGLKLKFSPKQTYYFGSSIFIKSNLFLEGNNAVLYVYSEEPKACNLFNMTGNTDLKKNVLFRDLTLVGRTNESQNFGDQAFHICIDGFTLQNVTIKNFSFGLHTYGRSAAAYTVPQIPNKNWLIENCTIKDTVMGLCCSELDGIIIKNSSITGIFNPPDPNPESGTVNNQDGDHNIYFSSNCLNVSITNTILGIITGDAIHKQFSVVAGSSYADISKNHFYTDITIHNCDSALCISEISENVMCDNIFATQAMLLVEVSSADNVIISNSNLSQTRHRLEGADGIGGQGFLSVGDSSKIWIQNSCIDYSEIHRVYSSRGTNSYYYNMCINETLPINTKIIDGKTIGINKKHTRSYVGTNFDIANYRLKFTGCNITTSYGTYNYYFEGAYCNSEEDDRKICINEYWDNCVLETSTGDNLFRTKCLNNLPAGLTLRNCYFHNSTASNSVKALVKPHCAIANCTCRSNESCFLKAKGKSFPWLHIENVIFDNAGYWGSSSWNHIINPHVIQGAVFTLTDAVNISGSYAANCYKITNGQKTHMEMLMGL